MSEPGATDEEGAGRWADILVGRYGLYTFVLSLGMSLFAVNQFVVATIMPTVVADLGGLDYYTWAFSLFAVGAIVGAASSGPLREAFGTRRSYSAAGLVLAVGLAGCALAPDMPSFVAFRLIQGIGGGAIASQAYGVVAIAYPERLRSRVLTVISTIWGVATVAGPGFGAVFAEPGMWRGAFWTLVPLTLVFVALAWRYVEGGAGHGRLSEMPYWRLAMLALAILLLSAASLALATWLRGALVAASIGLAALVFARDARAERTMFPRRATALGEEPGAGYWVIFLVSIVMAFVNTYTTFYLQALHGVSPFAAGYLFAIQSLMWTAAALVAAMMRRALETALIVAGLVLVLAASVAVVVFVDSGPVLAIAIAIGASGTGIGLLNNPTIQRIIASAPADEKHVAGTSVQTVRNIGISFGAGLSGMVAAAGGLVDGASREAVAHAMQWVYGVNVGIAVLPLLIALPLLARTRAMR